MEKGPRKTSLDDFLERELSQKDEFPLDDVPAELRRSRAAMYKRYKEKQRLPNVTISDGKFVRIDLELQKNLLEERELRDQDKKDLIGKAGANLVLFDRSIHSGTVSVKDDLKFRLEALWRRQHRLLVLDSGTTTRRIAVQLAEAPGKSRHLASLRVVTNGLEVARSLNKDKRPKHGTIVIGGTLRRETMSLIGTLAERSLETMSLRADISIIGTTSFNLLGEFGCNHEDESETKSRLLQSADIRCIAIDSTKVFDPAITSAWSFASFESRVDVIITDEAIRRRPDDPAQAKRFDRFHELADMHEVYLCVGKKDRY